MRSAFRLEAIDGGRSSFSGASVAGACKALAGSLVLTASVLFLGACSSSANRPTTDSSIAPPPSVSSTQVRRPAEIQVLQVSGTGGGAKVDLSADRPLVWTSFRNAAGDLVIELPNSVPGAGVTDVARVEGLIASVGVELLDDADRPLTRLVVQTRQPSEHSLAGEGQTLTLEMLPVSGEPAVAELSYEPLPEDDGMPAPEPERMAAVVEEPSRPAAEPRAETLPMRFGTAEEPLRGPMPTGVVASRLFSVDLTSSGDETSIQIAGDGEFEYQTFLLESPERFVLDLSGVVNTSNRSAVPVGSTHVDQVRVGQFKPQPDPVSRVVFDLNQTVMPRIEASADGLTVTFGGSAAAVMAAAASGPSEPAPAAPGVADREAEMVAEEAMAADSESTWSAPAEPAEVYEQPEAEEVVATYEPPPTAEPTYRAASDPVVEYEPLQSVGDARAQVAAVGTDDYTTADDYASTNYATGDVALFEAQSVEVPTAEEKVAPILESLGALVVNRQRRQYVGEPIDMSLKKADLVETLRSFATISDLNFVIQPGVTGSVTVELKGVPWDQAMEQILKINNLAMDIDGTIVRIAPVAQLRAEAEEQRRLVKIRLETEPLRTVIKSLSYARAEEIRTLLRGDLTSRSIISSRGTVQVDERTNSLIIRELPDNIDTVLTVIENLDAPEPQVTIEARIIEATKSFSRSLGIQWSFGYDAGASTGNPTGLAFPSNVGVDGSVGLLTGGDNGLLNLSLGNILNTFNLDAQLQVAENEGLVNVVSAPRVTTINNTAASIQSGVQLPVQTVANNTVSVQFVNATLQLTVTPQVTAEGTIVMDLQVAKRTPQAGLAIVGAGNIPISTREARTKVVLRDGGTAVIGGIYEVSSNQVQDRLPGLSNIPILGHLFRNRNRTNSNDELMIFITPRIVRM